MNAELEVQQHQENWPALQGSPKQVDWASQIRSQFAEKWESIIDAQEDRFGAGNEDKVKVLRQIARRLLEEPSARRWIDLRYDDAQDILRSAILEHQSLGARTSRGEA